jgi:hypothetical protein
MDTEVVTPVFTREQVLESLKRIVRSDGFAGSAQLSRFLSYVVEHALQNEAGALKESAIGTAVFHRGPGYDPKADPIVRVEARRLRARLDAYYLARPQEPVRISLPKGGYTPLFEPAKLEPTEPEQPKPLPALPASLSVRAWFIIVGLCGSAVVLAGIIAVYTARSPERLVSRFWSSVLNAGRPALLIPADSGLVMMQDLLHQPVSLQDYVTGDYRTRLPAGLISSSQPAAAFAGRRYTSIADLEFATRLAGKPEASRRGVVIRYARDVRSEDLKGGNLILLGARHSNPWVELFEKDATFRLEHDEQTGTFRVINTRPAGQEPMQILISPSDLRREIYGVITFHRNREGSGNVLVIAGSSVAGTEAAADLLLDPVKLLPLLRRAEVNGVIRGFDVLVHDRNFGGTARRGEVIGLHVEN